MSTTISASSAASVQALSVRPSSTATRRSGSHTDGLALPHQLHARRAHDDGREGVVRLERRQRLDGLAEALLVGDERAPALERVAHARALERVQHAAQLDAVQLRVLGVRERDGARRAVVLGDELVEQLGHGLLDQQRRAARR